MCDQIKGLEKEGHSGLSGRGTNASTESLLRWAGRIRQRSKGTATKTRTTRNWLGQETTLDPVKMVQYFWLSEL